jgi:1-deoxy-D-xylulose-5-phosphate synthase
MTDENPTPSAADSDDRADPAASLLSRVNSPQDLLALTPKELPPLCEEIRQFLLHSVGRTGGHLGSNLGVVELTVALHRVFDFRRDRCVWDVSHQAYVHKILTGRRERFSTLRQTGGLCGFTDPRESEYDLFHTGHAGTSVSLGLGLAMAAAHETTRPHVVTVIGDASLGAGVAFEALNHAGASGERMLVVLNDNEWSISRSVGALARHLTKIRSARVVQRAQQEIHGLLQSIPLIGGKVEGAIDQIREVLRHAMVQGHVFEDLGVTYVGPVDGHDVNYLEESLQRVRELDGVVLLHVLTQKGKGHPLALTHPERMHAASPQVLIPRPPIGRKETTAPEPKGPLFTEVFGKALMAVAESDVRIHAITAGMPSGTGLGAFAERFPNRFHDVGICEQHAASMAAGMARGGLRPVVALYSTFLQRSFDQIFQEISLSGLPVVLCIDRAGFVGQDGPTHHGVFDIAFLRPFPRMVIAAPRDASDLRRMMELAVRGDRPFAIRYPRARTTETEVLHVEERAEMTVGVSEVLREGSDVVIWAFGAMVNEALAAADSLAGKGVAVGVVDARFAKPLDEALLARHAREYRHLITVEEHQRAGGFGSAVLEAVSRMPEAPARVRNIGVPDRYIEHMTGRDEQLRAAGIDADSIERSVLSQLRTSLV